VNIMEYKDTPESLTEPDKPVTRHRPKGRGINPLADFMAHESKLFLKSLPGETLTRSRHSTLANND